ncbi:hypothetical protein [Actinomadura terrae]|uniref:hypothetical protein n=1 Tax=Actinomadura terrae TaxID=604353 RepID=UPI001FA8160A|nr:hypothetical protein [Actinomadura terrae]
MMTSAKNISVVITAVAIAVTSASPAVAAVRNYEAEICSKSHLYAGSSGNVGGYNQNNRFVHTPNFNVGNERGCGYKPKYWFMPNQTIEINVYNQRTEKWDRYYRKFSKCPITPSNPGRRSCSIR